MIAQAKFALLGAALLLASCASTITAPAAANVSQIVSTTSFGMCVGYCTTRLEISGQQAVLIREARGGRGAPQGLPEQRYTATLTDAEWNEFSRLAAGVDLAALPGVIGCPDCADGGAESLAIVSASGSRRVSFEFGADVQGATSLLARVRALRARLTPES